MPTKGKEGSEKAPKKASSKKASSKKKQSPATSISAFDLNLEGGYSDVIRLEDFLSGIPATILWAKAQTLKLDKEQELLTRVSDAMLYLRMFSGAKDTATAATTLIQPFDKLFEIPDYSEYVMTSRTVGNSIVYSLAWMFLESLSNLAIYPIILEQLTVNSTTMSQATKAKMSNTLIFTFALRNIVAKIAFQTVISKAVYDALRGEVAKDATLSWKTADAGLEEKKGEGDRCPWKDAVAFVGFNRLFSPNNTAGVSISSDIDFKLVINTDTIKFAKGAAKKGADDEAAKKAAKKKLDKRKGVITKALNNAMAAWIDKFDKARLTLEVEDFTTKDLAEVAEVLKKFQAEQNFYASMLKNNCLICGNKYLYAEFIGKVEAFANKSSNNFILAKKTFAQYLGDSDKGSILAIKHLDLFKKVVEECAKPLKALVDTVAGTPALYTFCNETNFERKAFFALPDSKGNDQKGDWLTSQLVFYKLTKPQDGDETVLDALVADPKVIVAVNAVAHLFPSISGTKPKNIILRIAKLLKGITDDEILTFEESNRIHYRPHDPKISQNFWYQIGSPMAAKEVVKKKGVKVKKNGSTIWVITIKFVCCRLSDFFSSVPLSEYQKWNTSATAQTTYDDAKLIANAINVFALKLQTAIYLVCTHRSAQSAIAASHQTIDNLYSRVTKNEFYELLVQKTRERGGIREAVETLVVSLAGILSAAILVDEGQKIIGTLDALAAPVPKKPVKGESQVDHKSMSVIESDGMDFFLAMFDLAYATAQTLNVD